MIETTVFTETIVTSPLEESFSTFVDHIREWWPREYTWSQEGLEKMVIEPVVNGKCYETGPMGFRCDWGRVLEIERPAMITFTWQISADRIPQPDPEKASTVIVTFKTLEDGRVRVRLIHSGFERHGGNWQAYEKAMNSEKGWPFIIQRYHSWLEKGKNG